MSSIEKLIGESHPVDILQNITIPQGDRVMNATPVSEKAVMFCGKNVTVQPFVTFDGMVFLDDDVLIGPYTFLRGPLYVGKGSRIGPHCEVTRSIILENSIIAHKNIVPDSIIGSNVWLAGGATCCNIRIDKREVKVKWKGIEKKAPRFGAIIDDDCKLGVCVMVMPGTQIKPGACIVGPKTIRGVVG